MAHPFRLWLEIEHQPAFRSGGWAYVLAEGRAVSGAAGGDRAASAEAIALAGLIAALGAAPAGAAVTLMSASPSVAAALRRLNGQGEAPSEDLALWAALTTAVKAHILSTAPATRTPRTPTAFAAAWAELARDKAKTRPFRAAIPKSNLAQAGVPA